jgi:2-methylcitrate dehydratase PrpD
VIALRDRVDASPDASIRDDEAYVKILLKNGKVLEKHIQHAIGSLYRPMTDKDLEAKFLGLTADILTDDESRRLLALCWNLGSSDDVAGLASATVPGRPVASAAT